MTRKFACQALLGLVDAAYSGDWSRIGAISTGTYVQLDWCHSHSTAAFGVWSLFALQYNMSFIDG